MSIQAIPTRYAGCFFRSRLEARWAVFFDTLNVKWEYEKEGFQLKDGNRYLPDFWLPKERLWIVVKGQEPTNQEIDCCRKLGAHQAVFLVRGVPLESWGVLFCFDLGDSSGGSGEWEAQTFYCEEKLGLMIKGGVGKGFFADCGFTKWLNVMPLDHRLQSIELRNNKAEEAAQSAKSARFEFGESGAAS